ncbi:SGNH/GDSL hydrolase family protein [Streptococcus sciuri]|uniref:SGNH/GDSL hydrolase family protein n=1 Tax=Streptococcus sciuri TaxID=2973939 RepID=A0ABT2F6Q9_9STRE|nr:SGNH/GDSL hydrolase family protein [Streptococcus sciuri]MCS4488077.1 SGNH/GDSL hydrolase family protein [Streptococcus sciuri]
MNRKSVFTGLAFFLVSLILSIGLFSILIPKSNPKLTKSDFLRQNKKTLTYVAIGDSLTQGVGDTTNQGGFVPILAQALQSKYGYMVHSENYGISGNTSSQILSRMKKQTKIQRALKQSQMMTLTVGGNDVMAVIRKNLTKLSVDSFKKPAKAYQKRLRAIIELARKDNSNLPIYILGIYNPFYLNFPDMTQMQEVVDNWNTATKEITKAYQNVYFVPINDALYKGIEGKEGVVQTSGNQTSILNDALFEGDHFHPNNIGYQIMSDQVMEKISETKDSWTKD